MITENLSTLKIHKLTQAQYKREVEAGRIDASALYLTPDEASGATKTTLFSGAPDALGMIIVSESIYNFDLVVFNLQVSDNLFDVVIYPSQYSDGKKIAFPFYMATNSTTWQYLYIDHITQNGQQLRSAYWSGNPYTIKNVYGIKFG